MDRSCVGSIGAPALAGVSLTSIHYLSFYMSYIIKDCYICICRICLRLPVLQRFFTVNYVLYVIHYYILVCRNSKVSIYRYRFKVVCCLQLRFFLPPVGQRTIVKWTPIHPNYTWYCWRYHHSSGIHYTYLSTSVTLFEDDYICICRIYLVLGL